MAGAFLAAASAAVEGPAAVFAVEALVQALTQEADTAEASPAEAAVAFSALTCYGGCSMVPAGGHPRTEAANLAATEAAMATEAETSAA